MDAVYILGTGSLVGDLEILYSVRSLATHMIDLRDVYVVGEKPSDLPGAIHVPAADTSKSKWENAYNKTLEACAIPELSDDFLLMNDDFFILEPFEGAEWPFYSLKNANGGPAGPLSFQVHCPIRLNKDWYSRMPSLVGMPKQFSPRSFYANFYKAPPTMTSDFILRTGEGVPLFDEQTIGWPCFSVSNSAFLSSDFNRWLFALYPNPSRFESK